MNVALAMHLSLACLYRVRESMFASPENEDRIADTADSNYEHVCSYVDPIMISGGCLTVLLDDAKKSPTFLHDTILGNLNPRHYDDRLLRKYEEPEKPGARPRAGSSMLPDAGDSYSSTPRGKCPPMHQKLPWHPLSAKQVNELNGFLDDIMLHGKFNAFACCSTTPPLPRHRTRRRAGTSAVTAAAARLLL